MKRAIDVGLFGELADPRVVARLAARAEERGWDGFFPIGLPGPEALAELAAEIREARPGGLFDLIMELPPDTDLGPWERAGLTWAVTFFGLQPTEAGVRAVIDAGPG
jgi:hypothetical protein